MMTSLDRFDDLFPNGDPLIIANVLHALFKRCSDNKDLVINYDTILDELIQDVSELLSK